jgi:hypothetical protein
VLLLWDTDHEAVESARQAASWRRILQRHAELGLRRIPADQLPPSCQAEKGLVIAVRPEMSGREKGSAIRD